MLGTALGIILGFSGLWLLASYPRQVLATVGVLFAVCAFFIVRWLRS